MTLRNLLIAAVGLAFTAGAAGAASADTPWQDHHPRRVEVNHRLDNLNHSIRVDRRDGQLTAWQARRLHDRVHLVRVHERFDARHNDSHLTRYEQWRLNHQENRIRHHIPA